MSDAEITFEEYLYFMQKNYGFEGYVLLQSEIRHLEKEFKRMSSYEKKVMQFNIYSGMHYSCGVRFLTFRCTKNGILVGYTCGKPEEIAALRDAVGKAGEPYYCKF